MGIASVVVFAVAGLWMRGGEPAYAQVFRRDVECRAGTNIQICVSADMRYVLKLDGRIVGRGPDGSASESWTYRRYDFPLSYGRHRFEAVVYHGGPSGYKPMARLSHAPGFFCDGLDGWRVVSVPLDAFSYGGRTGGAFAAGLPNVVRGSSPEYAVYEDSRFKPAEVFAYAKPPNKYAHVDAVWNLVETTLPPQAERIVPLPEPLFPQTVAANTEAAFDVDLRAYVTAYPILKVRNGAGSTIRCAWAESAAKANAGSLFEDMYFPDGQEGIFTTSWIRCGSLVRITVRTAEEPLTIESIELTESRYPLAVSGSFLSDDCSLVPVWNLCRRGLEVCAHDTVWDCPFYEQLAYLGDTRVQFLGQNVLAPNEPLQKHVMECFSASRRSDGIMFMNAPCDGPRSPSATFTLIYPLELADFMKWHDDPAWLKRQLPALTSVMTALALYENDEGLLENLPGWCFVDWAKWPKTGEQPGCGIDAGKLSSIENLFYIHALASAAEICMAVGERELAAVWMKRRDRAVAAVRRCFWNPNRNLVSDDPSRTRYSEHAQALAIPTDVLTMKERAECLEAMSEASDLARASVYFSHYLFEAFGYMGRTDKILDRLDLWRHFVRDGYRTPPETETSSRSDCHGWGAHPIYHLARYFAGVSPDRNFFSRVRVAPCPASLHEIHCKVPHPQGMISVDLHFADERVKGKVHLPSVNGVFVWKGKEYDLVQGDNEIDFDGSRKDGLVDAGMPRQAQQD